MPRISPVAFFRACAVACALVMAGCSSGDDAASSTTTAADSAVTTTSPAAATTDAPEPTDNAEQAGTTDQEITTVAVDDDSGSDNEASEESDDEIRVVCAAYLDSISFGTVDEGLTVLTDILGADAPPGVQDALGILRDPEGDIEGFFAAQSTVDGYVLPICREQFTAAIVPAATDAEAASAFLAAVRDGDLAAAERLAPVNIIVSFDWNGFPDAIADFNPDESAVTMLLEPTVTVLCQLADGAVETCAFGE